MDFNVHSLCSKLQKLTAHLPATSALRQLMPWETPNQRFEVWTKFTVICLKMVCSCSCSIIVFPYTESQENSHFSTTLRLSYHFSVCCASVVDNANQSLNHLKYHKVIATQLPCGLLGPLRVRLPGAVSHFALLVIQPCIHACNVTQFLSNDVLQTLRNVKPCLSIWSTKLLMISQARPHYMFDSCTYIKPTTKHISTFLVNNLAFFCCFTHFELF